MTLCDCKTNKDIIQSIPKHLRGDGYEIPNAPPLSPAEERQLIEKMKLLKIKAFDPNTGKMYPASADHAKDIAEYENMRHHLTVRYSFVVHKTAKELCRQCHRGMQYGDLCNAGYAGIMNVIDKWPPFLFLCPKCGEYLNTDKCCIDKEKCPKCNLHKNSPGCCKIEKNAKSPHLAPDKKFRFLTSAQKAVRNAMCRFLDLHNRPVRIPSHKIEQMTIKLQAVNIEQGKKSKSGKRKGPGAFEKAIQNLLSELRLKPSDVENKSLKDLAMETGEVKVIAHAVGLDISSVMAIIDSTISVDVPINDEDDNTAADLIQFEPYDSDFYHSRREIIEKALEQLPERNANILRDHFLARMSIGELHQKYGFSKVRASQLIQKSINQFRANQTAMDIIQHKLLGGIKPIDCRS